MASGQLPEFIINDQWPPVAPEPWTTMSGRDVGGLSQAPSKTQINHRTQRSVAGAVVKVRGGIGGLRIGGLSPPAPI